MTPTRVGLIGCGKIGQIHATALAGVPEAALVATCDASRDRAEAFAAKYGGRAFGDVGEMLRSGGVEAVVIGTPHPLHAEPTIRAAEAGVHVLVEKPMAATLRDCDAMIAAARKAGVTLGVISQRRFSGNDRGAGRSTGGDSAAVATMKTFSSARYRIDAAISVSTSGGNHNASGAKL